MAEARINIFARDLASPAFRAARRSSNLFRNSLRRTGAQLGSVIGRFNGLAAITGVIGGISFAGFTSQIFEVNRMLRSLSGQFQVSIQDLNEYRVIAREAGIDFDRFASAIGDLNERVSEAAREGTGTSFEILTELGLSAERLNLLNPLQQLEVFADALRETNDQGVRFRVVNELMSDAGRELLPILQNGAADLLRMREEAGRLSQANGEASESIEEARMTLVRFQERLGNQGVQLLVTYQDEARELADAILRIGRASLEAGRLALQGSRLTGEGLFNLSDFFSGQTTEDLENRATIITRRVNRQIREGSQELSLSLVLLRDLQERSQIGLQDAILPQTEATFTRISQRSLRLIDRVNQELRRRGEEDEQQRSARLARESGLFGDSGQDLQRLGALRDAIRTESRSAFSLTPGLSILEGAIDPRTEQQEQLTQEVNRTNASKINSVRLSDEERQAYEAIWEAERRVRLQKQGLLEDVERITDEVQMQPQTFLTGWTSAIDGFRGQLSRNARLGLDFGRTFGQGLQRSLEDEFFSFFEDRVFSLRDVLNDLDRDFRRLLSRTISTNITDLVTEGATSLITGIVGTNSGFGINPGTNQPFPVLPASDNIQPPFSPPIQGAAPPPGFRGAAGGAFRPQEMRVTIVNQSGEPQQIESTEVSETQDRQMIRIVLGALSRNVDGSRNALRALVGNG